MESKIKNFFLSVLCVFTGASCSTAEDAAKLSPAEAWNKINSGALVIDVRTAGEFGSGHLDKAVHIPFDEIAERRSELGGDHTREIVLYCRSGRRSEIAVQTLRRLGYQNVYNGGGYTDLLAQKGMGSAS